MTNGRLLQLLLLVLVSGATGAGLALAICDRQIQAPKPQADPGRAALAAKGMDYSRSEPRMEEAIREPIPAAPVAATPPTSRAAVHDPEWDTFPRTSGFAGIIVAGSRSGLDVKNVFRNQDVNPEDTYLTASDRAFLADLVARGSADLSDLRTTSVEVASTEFDVLVRGGKTRTVNMADYIASLTPSERKEHDDRIAAFLQRKRESYEAQGLPADTVEKMLAESQPVSYIPDKLFGEGMYATRAVDGNTVLGATLSDLPKARETLDVRDKRLLRMASDIVGIFVLRDCLERSQADRLVVATANRTKANPKMQQQVSQVLADMRAFASPRPAHR